MKKAAEWFAWVVLGVTIGILSFVMIASDRGWEFDAVLSGSMEPAFKVGGLVVIRPAQAEDITVGDVISFRLPGIDTPICHRVVEMETVDGGLFFRTKGDANESPDPGLVPAESVTGREVFYLPYVGYLGNFAEFGRTAVPLGGKDVPIGAMVMLALGLGVIGLILSDVLQGASSSSRRKAMLNKRRERLMRRRRLFLGAR